MSATGLEAVEAQLKEIRALLVKQQMLPAAVSLEEAARLLSCSPKHIGRLVKSGQLLVTKVGELRRVPMSEVHRLVSLPEEGQKPPPRTASPRTRPSIPESVRLKAMLKRR